MKQTIMLTFTIILSLATVGCDDPPRTPCPSGCYLVSEPGEEPVQCFCPTPDEGGETDTGGTDCGTPTDLPRPATHSSSRELRTD